MEEVFAIRSVGFSYGGVTALKEIGFTVERGESLAVLGANGSGKSTLLKVMNGLIFPTAGEVFFFGGRLTEESLCGPFREHFRKTVGFVFSEPDVQLFCPTVYDEAAFGPIQLGLSHGEVKRRAGEALEFLGIAHLKDRPPYALSSGEKKKVAIASVLSVNPEVILFDEPTNGLDPRSQVWLLELLEGLKALKKTVVFATHDLSLVEDLADKAVVLNEEHTVEAFGETLKILSDKGMLLRANIIHEHAHRHGSVTHVHSHGPFSTHDDHEEEG